MGLCKVVKFDQNKCVNCHTCISVCPVKYCLKDDSTVDVNDDLCIGCGKCYQACPHGAISYVDDFDEFINAVNRGKKISLIVSPAIISEFPEQHNKILSFLKSNFVLQYVYDEGIGAEIAAILCMDYLKKSGKIPIIYHHCPTVVDFIKIYQPELIDYLAPIQSPTIISAKLLTAISNFKGLIAYLGPCLSKKREFNDPETKEIIKFNITFESIQKYIEHQNIDLNQYNDIEYDNPPAERGSVFCKPEGFINIIKRYYDNLKATNVEGDKIYKKYLSDLNNSIFKNFRHLPLLIDILNCEYGCFNGPGLKNKINCEEMNWLIDEREEEASNNFTSKMKAQQTFQRIISDNQSIIFKKKYSMTDIEPIYTLNDIELKDIFTSLNKNHQKDFLDCRSCGFDTCREFATAVKYGLNISSNCRVFTENNLKNSLNEKNSVTNDISITSNQLDDSYKSLTDSALDIRKNFSTIKTQIDNIIEYNAQLKENSEKFQPIVTAISDISEQINLLSFNASIEASRTGNIGKGFSVVSTEIRNLADKTRSEINKISPVMELVINNTDLIKINIDDLNDNSVNFNSAINNLSNAVKKIDSYINHLTSLVNKFGKGG